MEILSVGDRNPQWRDFPEGFLMSYDDVGGLSVYFFLRSPTPDILAETGDGRPFEIYITDIEKVGFFTLRFGSLPYGDCAFSPCLFPVTTPLALPPDQILHLGVIVIDTAVGEIVAMRRIPLGQAFSVKLCNWFTNRLMAGVTRQRYAEIVQNTYARYSTEDLRRMAKVSYRLE